MIASTNGTRTSSLKGMWRVPIVRSCLRGIELVFGWVGRSGANVGLRRRWTDAAQLFGDPQNAVREKNLDPIIEEARKDTPFAEKANGTEDK